MSVHITYMISIAVQVYVGIEEGTEIRIYQEGYCNGQ